jgi:adenylate cyclase
MRSIIRDVLIIGLGPPILLFIIGAVVPQLFDPLETATYDLRLKANPLAAKYLSPIVIVDIDDKTINELGDPDLWPRTHYAQVIDQLAQARMVGFYVPLYNPDNTPAEQIKYYSDYYGSTIADRFKLPAGRGPEVIAGVLSTVTLNPALSMAIGNNGRVFLTFWATDGRTGKGPLPFPVTNIGRTADGYVKLPADMVKHTQFLTPLDVFKKQAKGMGFGEFYPDPDGRMRTYPLFIQGKDALYPSLALSMAMNYIGAFDQVEVVTGDLLKIENKKEQFKTVQLTMESGTRLRYLKPREKLKTVSFLDVYKKTVAADIFKDKIVFVGSSSVNFGPLPANGVGEQAVVFTNIIHGLSVTRSPRAFSFVLTLLFAAGMTFVILRFRLLLGIPAAVAGPVLYLLISFLSFQSGRVWMELVSPVFSLVLVAAVAFVYKNATEGRSSQQLTTVLEKRLPASVLKEIVKLPAEALALKPANLSLLRAEIKNLSPLIPKYPEIAGQVLAEFIPAMAEIVFAHDGIITSYIPGGLIAAFGAPREIDDHALAAVKAAVEMRRKFSILGARLQAEGRGLLELGVVLDSADVLIGFFKPTQDYQVMGPALALVDSLATLNRRLKTTILVTEHISELLQDKARFRVVLESGIAGPTGQVRVYELLRVGV